MKKIQDQLINLDQNQIQDHAAIIKKSLKIKKDTVITKKNP